MTGPGVARARAGLQHVVAVTALLGAWNVLLAVVPALPLTWASFPVHDTNAAAESVLFGGLVLVLLAWQLRSRGFLSWVLLVGVLVWAVAGFVILAWPGLPRPGLVPALGVLGVLIARRRAATARGTWSRDPRRAGTVYVVMAVFVLSVLGTRALGQHFQPPIVSWVGAVYYVVITFSTVGYGDVVPVTSVGRTAAILVVTFAFLGFALAAGVVVPALVRTKFKEVFRALDRVAEKSLKDHAVVAGDSAEAVVIVNELREQDARFILVYEDAHFLDRFEAVDFQTLQGSSSESSVLKRASIEQAKVLVVCDQDDSKNAFTILSARDLAENVHIVAMAKTRENLDKLRLAGADVIVSPTIVGGSLLARAALGEEQTVEDLMQAESHSPTVREAGTTRDEEDRE